MLKKSTVQKSVAICAEKDADGIFELVQKDKQLVGIGGNDELRESSEFGEKPENNIVHAVQVFRDVGYLRFHLTTRLSIVSQALRSELVTLGSSHF